jgi:hypothetical protein
MNALSTCSSERPLVSGTLQEEGEVRTHGEGRKAVEKGTHKK